MEPRAKGQRSTQAQVRHGKSRPTRTKRTPAQGRKEQHGNGKSESPGASRAKGARAYGAPLEARSHKTQAKRAPNQDHEAPKGRKTPPKRKQHLFLSGTNVARDSGASFQHVNLNYFKTSKNRSVCFVCYVTGHLPCFTANVKDGL